MSQVARVTVLSPPSFVTQPLSQKLIKGQTARFSVVTAGTEPISYQWLWYGTNIAGATESSYSKTNLALADSGPYSVSLSNIAGTLLSSNAALSIRMPEPPRFETISLVSPGVAHLAVNGEFGEYTVQSASNLVDWVSLQSLLLTNHTVELFLTSPPPRFYRLVPAN
jgi:hypothetical protein